MAAMSTAVRQCLLSNLMHPVLAFKHL